MKAIKKWKDPIEEIRWVRAKLAKEWAKDPKAFNERITKRALDAGMQVSDLKPISLKELRAKKNKIRSKTNGRSGKK
jgi:hypothetical protein